MRLDLPAGEWAELREPDEIPRKAARRFRDVLFALARPAAGVDQDQDPDALAADVGQSMLASADGLSGMEDMAEALVLAVVSEWSYGSVCQEVLDDLPDAAIKAIDRHCQSAGYVATLMPDFGVSPDPDSPTPPS
jgi:hypothetical protein